MTGEKKDLLRRVKGTAAAGLVLAFLGAAPSARATLVVFEDGRHLRVASYEVVDGDRLTVGLVGGGSMTIPLDVVERLVDDEYERPAPVAPEDANRIAVGSPAEASRSIRAFSESPSSSSPSSLSSPYSSQILAAAREHKVDPAFIAAVIKVESNGHLYAVSRKGARGLMQLMPATARRLGVKSPFDPRDNIRGGVAYLAELAERFGETNADLILAAYNAGESAVEEYGGVPPYRETRDYVKRVLALWGSPARTLRAAL
jgi:soluble lytic murein transglycosylase-like protein